jgi:hypothetical protein
MAATTTPSSTAARLDPNPGRGGQTPHYQRVSGAAPPLRGRAHPGEADAAPPTHAGLRSSAPAVRMLPYAVGALATCRRAIAVAGALRWVSPARCCRRGSVALSIATPRRYEMVSTYVTSRHRRDRPNGCGSRLIE